MKILLKLSEKFSFREILKIENMGFALLKLDQVENDYLGILNSFLLIMRTN